MENPAKKSPLLNYRRCLSPYLSPFRAFSTAFFITILEFVAPDTASTSMLCPSAILPAVISAGFPRRLFIVSHAFQINRRKNHAAKEKNAYGKQKEGTHIFSPHQPSSLAAMERYTSKNPYSKNSFFDKPIDFFMYSSLLAASRMIPESIPQKLKMAGIMFKSSRKSSSYRCRRLTRYSRKSSSFTVSIILLSAAIRASLSSGKVPWNRNAFDAPSAAN